jgi:GTP-binding protein Era
MQASMMNFVKSAFEDADILIYMVEIESKTWKTKLFNKIIHAKNSSFLLLNKIDTSNQEKLEEQVAWAEKYLMPKFSHISFAEF